MNILEERGGELSLFQKFWGSFEVVLRNFFRFFEVVVSCYIFPKFVFFKGNHSGVQNGCGGWGSRPLLENVLKEAVLFSR